MYDKIESEILRVFVLLSLLNTADLMQLVEEILYLLQDITPFFFWKNNLMHTYNVYTWNIFCIILN